MACMLVDFASETLKRNVGFVAYLPTDMGKEGPLRSLYLLHGLHGDMTSWLVNSRVAFYAREKGICLFLPNGENMFYADSAITGNRYGTFVSQELVSFTRKTFPLSMRREDTFIGGLSMGGFGAITNGLRHPETFGGVIGLSSALIKQRVLSSTNPSSDGKFSRTEYQAMFGLEDIRSFSGSENDYDALAENVAGNTEKPRFFLACGTEDALFPPNEQFRKKLQGLGYDVTWSQGPGAHTWDYWERLILPAIQWM
ncbi:MAG: esterase family protein [Sphaerochaeta sp.]|jgi:S-formylglutathione hydrolase FrmB|nr:esterase family protein [Sphaerochaeta sp.]MCI2096934.1 esterase family protein [Sphaerochaeta sp.]MCI2103950.1 esterase family protein [Sphaerochaeta sp.]